MASRTKPQANIIPAHKIYIDKVKFYNDLEEKGCHLIPGPFYDVQEAFLGSSARFKFYRGARRVGKSHTAALDVFPEVLKEGTRGWIVGPSYEIAEKEFRYLVDFIRKYARFMGMDIRKFKIRENASGGDLLIKTPWNSEVVGKSASNPFSLVGEELDWVIMSEAARQNELTWTRDVMPSLVTRKGRAIFPSTPDSGGEWLYDLEVMGQTNKDWELFHCPQWKVPHIEQEEVEIQRRQMGKDQFEEQVGGEWKFFSGRVYATFSREKNVIPSFPIPTSWPVYAGLDFGLRDATAMMYSAKSPEGDYYLFHEHYKRNLSTQEHCTDILHFERDLPNTIKSRVADYHALGRQLMLDWQHHGVRTKPCINDTKGKRDRFLNMLESKDGHIPYHIREFSNIEFKKDEVPFYPRIFVFEECENFIKEMLWYRWKDGSRKEGSAQDTVGEDHAINAAEYMIHDATNDEHRLMRQSLQQVQTKATWASYVQ